MSKYNTMLFLRKQQSVFSNYINYLAYTNIFVFLSFIISSNTFSQEIPSNRITKEFLVKTDTIILSDVSISPFYFKLYKKDKTEISPLKYSVNYPKAMLFFTDKAYFNSIILAEFESLPEYLTKTYQNYNENLIVENSGNQTKIISNIDNKQKIKPFNGLETGGNLSRGITLGNNQDGVLNSNFDLQLYGKLSPKVTLKANITDNFIPINNNGYTQRLNEFDRVFIEMYSDKWKVKAGDIYFDESDNYFLNFKKKVSGVAVSVNLGDKEKGSNFFTSGALVRGKYTEIDFNGLEGNQGPYRIASLNQPFLLIVANSETVFVNGIPLKRGKKQDYVIDYNTSELTFNTTYPINATMRIHVEFQAGDEQFARFVSFNKANYHTNKLKVQVGFYSENDVKNQPLQQELNDAQLQLLAISGDDFNGINALSAIAEAYVENKIQYKKIMQNGIETFVFSTNENDALYAVRFNFTGSNNGDYSILNTIATGRIYQYIPPIAGVKQGDYSPNIKLIAANKLQLTTMNFNYNPSKKTLVKTNFAFSNMDKNLFSNLDDENNTGFAGNINWKQLVIDKKWKLQSNVSYKLIKENFNSIESINKFEFKRNWNLINPFGQQQEVDLGLHYYNKNVGMVMYELQNLNLGNFKGVKHHFSSKIDYKKYAIKVNANLLSTNATLEKTNFTSIQTAIKKKFKQFWLGTKLDFEHNLRTNNQTQQINNLSHKNTRYNTYIGLGDSTKINLEIGYTFSKSDSLQMASLQNVNKSNSFYLKSQLIQKKHASLNVYLNYSERKNKFFLDDESLNTSVNYRQNLFNNIVNFNTIYQTSSGVLPKQEYSYLQVDPGNGFYTWLDFNNDGIQDLDEFEIAQFTDQATYVRILLPTTQFIRTNLTSFKQIFNINPTQWVNNKGFKKIAAHFNNQASLQIENKQLKNAALSINPFKVDNALSLQYNLRNNLYFNRGKQHFSTTYSYLKSNNKTAYITGLQENNVYSNQLQFAHKLHSNWLLHINGNRSETVSKNDQFISRNFELHTVAFTSKIAYLIKKNGALEFNYKHQNKENLLLGAEHLQSHNFGTSFRYAKKTDVSIHAAINYINNNFIGNQNSPVAFQILEGLQKGNNFTWNLLLQKKLSNYLNLNLNYNARKSPNFKVIHTGTVQLRANF